MKAIVDLHLNNIQEICIEVYIGIYIKFSFYNV